MLIEHGHLRRFAAAAALAGGLSGEAQATPFGKLTVVQNDTNNNPTSVSVAVGAGSSAGWSVSGQNRGDYDLAFDAGNGIATGVPIICVTEDGRDNSAGGDPAGAVYATASFGFDTKYWTAVHKAVVASDVEWNVNSAFAFFRFDEWIAARVSNSANNGALTTLVGSPGLALGTHVVDVSTNAGVYEVNLTSLGASSQAGVLLVCGAKNEDNYALSRANADGTFTLICHDNGADKTDYENDGVAFAYLSAADVGTQGLAAIGRVNSDATTDFAAGSFTVTKGAAGKWHLAIPGQGDSTGTLLVSSEGAGINNIDNIVAAVWDSASSRWTVTSRDLTAGTLQDGGSGSEDMFSFAFFSTNAILPAVTLTAPASGAAYPVGANVDLAATASAVGGSVVSVEFFANGQSLGVDTDAPYTAQYQGLSAGTLILTAAATDTRGGMGVSAPVTVWGQPPSPDNFGLSAGLFGLPAWTVQRTSLLPRQFDAPGANAGDIDLRINGLYPRFDQGVVLAANWDETNSVSSSRDNNIAPYENAERTRTYISVADNTDNNAAGTNPTTTEESAAVAVAFFPYADGWIGANVSPSGTVSFGNLPAGVSVTKTATGNYAIAGLPPVGNVLAQPDGNNGTTDGDNTLSVRATGAGWLVDLVDNGADSIGTQDAQFSFVYLPTNAVGVFSGRVNSGACTALNAELAALGCTVSVSADAYTLTFGDGSRVNPRTAALFVCGDSTTGGASDAARDNIWSWGGAGNTFKVFSQDLPQLDGSFQAAGFRFVAVPFDPLSILHPAPAVTVTAPAGGTALGQGAVATLTATAADPDGTVSTVEFFVDGVKVGEDADAPYACMWIAGALGQRQLAARATDNQGYVGLSAAVTVAVVPPAGVGGLYFDGVDDYVTFGTAAALGLSNLTVECWFKQEGPGLTASSGVGGVNAVPLVGKGRGEGDGGSIDCNYFLGIRPEDGVLVADFEDLASGLNHPVAGSTPITRGVWHHAAVSCDGAAWALYLDGNLEAELAVCQALRFDSIQHAGLARALDSTGAPEGAFHGMLDEVRIWNRARTTAEIRAHMNRAVPAAAGLVGRWGMDDGPGASITSSAAGTLSGSLLQGVLWTTGAPLSGTAPPSLSALAPAQGITGQPLNLVLEAVIEDMDSPAVTVTFYGRTCSPSTPGPDFTVVALPDTQNYTAALHGGTPAHLAAQTDWCVRHHAAFVAHLGDISEHGDAYEAEWLNATNAMYRLEDPVTTGRAYGIPYSLAVGNHDQTVMWDPQSGSKYYNRYFGLTHFAGKPYFGGSFSPDDADNSYQLFSASGLGFLVINFEYDSSPDQDLLNWADRLLKLHSNRRAIVITHHTVEIGQPGAFSAQGQAIYDALKDNPNLTLMHGGHIHGEGRRSDTFQGRTVHALLSDYQSGINGGDGWMRLLTFSPSNNTLRVQTYSSTLDTYQTDADNAFTLPVDLTGALGTFEVVGTVSNVVRGSSVGVTWSGLEPSRSYEWYAVANDGLTAIREPTRTFATGTVIVPPSKGTMLSVQ